MGEEIEQSECQHEIPKIPKNHHPDSNIEDNEERELEEPESQHGELINHRTPQEDEFLASLPTKRQPLKTCLVLLDRIDHPTAAANPEIVDQDNGIAASSTQDEPIIILDDEVPTIPTSNEPIIILEDEGPKFPTPDEDDFWDETESVTIPGVEPTIQDLNDASPKFSSSSRISPEEENVERENVPSGENISDAERRGHTDIDRFGFPCGRSLGFFIIVNDRLFVRLRQVAGSMFQWYYLIVPLREDFSSDDDFFAGLAYFARQINTLDPVGSELQLPSWAPTPEPQN